MALGAQGNQVSWMILKRGLFQLGLGLTLGLAGGMFAGRALPSRILVQMTPTDPVTFVAITLVLSIVAIAACILPARRAHARRSAGGAARGVVRGPRSAVGGRRSRSAVRGESLESAGLKTTQPAGWRPFTQLPRTTPADQRTTDNDPPFPPVSRCVTFLTRYFSNTSGTRLTEEDGHVRSLVRRSRSRRPLRLAIAPRQSGLHHRRRARAGARHRRHHRHLQRRPWRPVEAAAVCRRGSGRARARHRAGGGDRGHHPHRPRAVRRCPPRWAR